MTQLMYFNLSKGLHMVCMAMGKFALLSSVFFISLGPVYAQEDTSNELANIFTTASDFLRSPELPGGLQIHGFASQAYITTSDNDVFGNSDKGGSFGFTELGLNASLHPLPRLQLSAQMLSRRAGKGNSGTPRLDYAFLDYRIFSQEVHQVGIRIGRLKNPFGFYNDTRDVAFTRPSILLPQSIYFDRTRNVALSSDSVQFYGETSLSKIGDFSFQFGVSRPIVDDKDTKLSLVGDTSGKLSPDVSVVGRGIFESTNKQFRLALSGIWLNIDYDPGASDSLSAGTIQFSPIYISAQYNAERWSLTSEYALRHFRYKDFNSPRFDRLDFYGESFYFQGSYRFHPKWEAILRYDVLFTDRKDRKGKHASALAAAAGGNIPAHSRFAKDLTVGLRWNISPEFMLRAEYHRINGTAWLSVLDNPPGANTKRHWNLFAVQASFRF